MNAGTLYWRAVVRSLPAIVLGSLLAGVVAYGISRRIEPIADVHFSYLVSLREREPATEFRFDGYYALQATDLFAETLARWLTTPEVIVAAHQAANLPLETSAARRLSQIVTAEKSAPQLVQVTVKDHDAAQALQLAQGLQTAMETNLALYHDQGIPALQFAAVPTTPWTGKQAVASRVIGLATAFFVFFLAVNIRLLVLSFKQHPSA